MNNYQKKFVNIIDEIMKESYDLLKDICDFMDDTLDLYNRGLITKAFMEEHMLLSKNRIDYIVKIIDDMEQKRNNILGEKHEI